MGERRKRFTRAMRVHRAPTSRADAVLASGQPLPLTDGVEGFVPVARGVKLWYRVVGTGPETVIVPCAGNDVDFDRLAAPGRRLLFYDVRNRGRSDALEDPTRLGFSVEVTDLEAIRQSFAIEQFGALGWSYHAGIIATYAIQHPERVTKMVMAAAIPVRASVRPNPARTPAPHLVAHLDQLEASGVKDSDPAAYCVEWRKVYVPLLMGDPTAFERLAAVCAYQNEWPWNVARSLVFVFAQLGSYDWRPHLRDVDVPTLVVHGSEDHDPVEFAREWVDAMPDARLLELAGVGQFPWAEAPDAFFTAVDAFLGGSSS